MTTKKQTSKPQSSEDAVQVYRVYIRATPRKIWSAITQPSWTARYGYYAPSKFALKPGGSFRSLANAGMKKFPGIPDVIGDGKVLECDPPRRLVHTWRMLMTPEMAAEGFTCVTYEIDPGHDGVSRLTVTHELKGAPLLANVLAGKAEKQGAGGGWNEVLCGLKTLLETGRSLPPQSGR